MIDERKRTLDAPYELVLHWDQELERFCACTMSQDDEPIESVELPIEDSIDLHTFAPRDIPDVVESYLEAAHEKGLSEVRIIHGRGTGFQKERVRQVLSKHGLVDHFEEATPDRGGWGATVVRLKISS